MNDRAFDSPLIGFSSGDDPIYRDFKEHVGPFHWTPVEVLGLAFPDLKVGAEEITVISGSFLKPRLPGKKIESRISIRPRVGPGPGFLAKSSTTGLENISWNT